MQNLTMVYKGCALKHMLLPGHVTGAALASWLPSPGPAGLPGRDVVGQGAQRGGV